LRRLHRPAQRLRQAIEGMPLETRAAMLDALGSNPIIVGAYTDREGGVCPMLAAHRNGGRTSFAAFATAWDRYARAGRKPRPATEREVRTLQTMLEASIDRSSGSGDGALGEAIAAHEFSRRQRVSRDSPGSRPGREEQSSRRRDVPGRLETGERDRTKELRSRHGWAWLRPFRRLDEYERALAELAEDEQRSHERV
jgi:hypothetical protein